MNNAMPLRSPSWKYVVRKVLLQALCIRSVLGKKMLCLSCGQLPKKPVTGRCGHTRCMMCTEETSRCPCGVPKPSRLCTNILIRDIIYGKSLCPSPEQEVATSVTYKNKKHTSVTCLIRRSRKPGPIPPFEKRRFAKARELVSKGMYTEAAVPLILLAISTTPIAIVALYELERIIQRLMRSTKLSVLIRTLNRMVHAQVGSLWVTSFQVECPICYNIMLQPITTPCGHTFCRPCIYRIMQIRSVCPLCSDSLNDFHLAQTDDTEFMRAVMGTNTTPFRIGRNIIPIFESAIIAYPHISCPLMINETDYRNIVKYVLDTGFRRFGMLALLRDDTYATFGTVVEVRDRVLLQNGQVILSTVGVSRFVVKEKFTVNGCPYARIQKIKDMKLSSDDVHSLLCNADQLEVRVRNWLPTLKDQMKDIVSCFGPFPNTDEKEWWAKPDGPVWLWWLIAILPLQTNIQVLMLSSTFLPKRLAAVFRTLLAMDTNDYKFNTTYPQAASTSRSEQ